MQADLNTPYSTLEPALILDAVESLGFRCNGYLQALNSYENRVYQIGIEDADSIIAKFYRPHRWPDETILEEHQFALELSEHEIPVVAPWMNDTKKTLFDYQEFRFSVFPRFRGRALEMDNPSQLEWMGRFIGRLHAVGACKPFHHRSTLTVASYGQKAYQTLLKTNFVPEYLKNNFFLTVENVLSKVEKRFSQIGEITNIRLHGDLHSGNVLWNDAGPHIVDLDDCLMGPAIQDIWMLLSGNEIQVKKELKHILAGYKQFHDFNPIELELIEGLRTLRMLHHSAWIANRWDDPTFPLNFPWFNSANYWETQLRHLNEQLELLNG